jgi:transcriptional regulator of heat shock response
MSKVHKILRRGESKGSGRAPRAKKGQPPAPETRDKNLSPEIEAFIADTRQKEKLLKQGIERLQEHARSLQQKLDETLHALKEQEKESRRIHAQAQDRETSWLKRLLSYQLP